MTEGTCWVCRTAFEFDAERVPSMSLETVGPVAPTYGAGNGSAPMCASCVWRVNLARRRRGLDLWKIETGVYGRNLGYDARAS